MARVDKTLASVFADPVRANIRWDDIEAMLVGLGATRSGGGGSRVRFVLNGLPATFHRPHPQSEANKPLVRSVREFLLNAGIQP